MKLLEQVQELLNKYNLEVVIPDEYKTVYKYVEAHPEKESESFRHPIINDDYLDEKYKKHIPQGWYGFAIGNPTPINWSIVIDKILDLLIKHDPDFEIHQIKIKFGSIRFYVESKTIEDIQDISILIMNKLFSNKLVY